MKHCSIAEIEGNGMIANAMIKYKFDVENVIIFARGVSNSNCLVQDEYDREIALLSKAIESSKSKGKKIVYFSSAGSVYGHCKYSKNEDSPLNPKTFYGYHKVYCENIIMNSSVDYLILRLPNIVGRKQNRYQLIPFLINQAHRGEAKILKYATRDILDIDDLSKLTVALIRKANSNEIFNLASGKSISVIKIFNKIQNILGTDAKAKLYNDGDKHNFSIEKLKETLNISFEDKYWELTLEKYLKMS